MVQRILGSRQLHLAARRHARHRSLRGGPCHPDVICRVPGPRSRVPFLRAPAQYRQTRQHRLPHDGRNSALGHRIARYVRYTGDRSIVAELYPNVQASIEGALANFTDASGYLVHADNETWMDARREPDKVAYSPRSTRANDIQALWYEQLRAGADFAAALGDRESAARWSAAADRLRSRFAQDFMDPATGRMADISMGASRRICRCGRMRCSACTCWTSQPMRRAWPASLGSPRLSVGCRDARPGRSRLSSVPRGARVLSQGCGLP